MIKEDEEDEDEDEKDEGKKVIIRTVAVSKLQQQQKKNWNKIIHIYLGKIFNSVPLACFRPNPNLVPSSSWVYKNLFE